jgi:hypothetical protein
MRDDASDFGAGWARWAGLQVQVPRRVPHVHASGETPHVHAVLWVAVVVVRVSSCGKAMVIFPPVLCSFFPFGAHGGRSHLTIVVIITDT